MTHDMREARINGWKAIASYLDRDESTAKRWETTRSLPVRRMPGVSNASVYADPSELAQWLRGPTIPEVAPASPRIRPSRRRWLIAAAIAGPIVVANATMASSQFQTATAQPRDAAATDRYLHGVHGLSNRTAAGITAVETGRSFPCFLCCRIFWLPNRCCVFTRAIPY